MEPWRRAIEKLKLLNKERQGPEWWSSNIVDSSTELSEKRDWALFYSWLTSPHTFNFENPVVPVTLDDLVNIPDKMDAYPPELKEERFQNGTVTHIQVTRRMELDSDDEKIE